MQYGNVAITLTAALALLGGRLCLAAEQAKAKATAPQTAAPVAHAAAPNAPLSAPRAGPARPAPHGGSSKVAEPHSLEKLVDINSASRAELKTLPGIGDAQAMRIIAARPYPSKAKLVADKVLPIEAYDALRGRIVAIQKEAPPSRKP